MANHFSALKRARQTERRTLRNRANTSRLRSALRDLREALSPQQLLRSKGFRGRADAAAPG